MSVRKETDLKRIKIVIGLVLLSLAGIISVQTWFISHAYRVKNETFQRNVNEALEQLSMRIENHEAYQFFKKNGVVDTQNIPSDLKTFSADSLKYFSNKNNNYSRENEVGFLHDKPGRGGFNRGPEKRYDQRPGHIHLAGNIDSPTIAFFSMDNDKDALAKITTPEELHNYLKKKRLLIKIASAFAMRDKTIAQRIDLHGLDTLISNEFADASIDIPFKFGILQKTNDSFEYISPGANKAELIGTQYKAQLFPDDFIMKPHFLVVYFPAKNLYLLKNTTILISSSTVFLFIIIMLFFWMIRTFLDQKKLSDMKTDFINNMTHEFKTPITTISLASEALKDPDVNMDTGRLNRLAGMIWEENRRLETQVEKVLQMARLDKGEVNLNKEIIDINELVQNAVDRIALIVEEREGTITCVCHAENHVMEVDEFHLNNIMSNLLDNAIKYSPGKPEIFVSTRNIDGKIEISVSDKGVGMAPEAQKRVFEKFFRVSTGNVHDVKGFGLGLAYVKSMVEAHGGAIALRSAPGKGSTFTILI